MDKFLEGLARYGTVKEGCLDAGISRETAYKWRRRWRWFADAWESAREDAYDELEKVAYQRGTDINEKNDRMIQFLLKGGRKEKYSDRKEIEHSGGLTIVVDK